MNDAACAYADAACALARTSSDGRFLKVNQTFCAWTGWRESELVEQRRLQDLLTMGGRIFHQTHLAPLLQMQGSVSEVKLDVLHRDGQTIPMVFNVVTHAIDGAKVHDIAAFVARDRDRYERELVLSRKNLQAMVAKANKLQAEALDQAALAEQMMGIVSHDLRNPLSTIQMATTFLARDDPTPNQQMMLGRMTRAIDRANRLICDLLDFTQASLGAGLSVTLKPFNIRSAISDTVDELALAFPERELIYQHAGEECCLTDTDRLSQLVGNLVANAVAYGQPDTPVLVASTVHSDRWLVSVTSSGAPISPEMQRQIFEPMVRGLSDSDSSRKVGLGLFIVSEIAKSHGGKVSVESSAESGTTFTAEFPRTPIAPANPPD